jgi:RHS repeat-associated protein
VVVTDYSYDAAGNRVKKETVDFSAVATSQSGGTSVGLTISAGPSSTPITFTSNGNLIGSVGSSISAIPPGALVVEYTNSGGNTSVEAVFTSSGEVNFSGTVYQQSTLTSASIDDFTLLFTNHGQSSVNTLIMDMNQTGNVYLAGKVIQELFSSGVAYVDNNYVFTANSDTAAFPYAISYALVGGEGREDLGGSSTLFRYYLKDHLGSTRAVWAPDVGTGQLIEATGYLPYGTQVSLITSPADDSTREKFSGKELDNDGEGPDEADPTNTITGVQLDYFGGRYYDAQVGRWISADPADQFFDKYNYCGDNSINEFDPDGRGGYGDGMLPWIQAEYGGAPLPSLTTTGYVFYGVGIAATASAFLQPEILLPVANFCFYTATGFAIADDISKINTTGFAPLIFDAVTAGLGIGFGAILTSQSLSMEAKIIGNDIAAGYGLTTLPFTNAIHNGLSTPATPASTGELGVQIPSVSNQANADYAAGMTWLASMQIGG